MDLFNNWVTGAIIRRRILVKFLTIQEERPFQNGAYVSREVFFQVITVHRLA